jgi:carbon-monoxide dehydrogenase small subunit
MALTKLIEFTLNGQPVEVEAEPRALLSDVLRQTFSLSGVHSGCEHGVCGACTVLLDGDPVRSCLLFAVQAAGHEVVTVEGIGDREHLDPVQEAIWKGHALQCGYCTPGIVLTAKALLQRTPHPSEEEVREALSGNLCRCTGYQFIVDAVLRAAQEA